MRSIESDSDGIALGIIHCAITPGHCHQGPKAPLRRFQKDCILRHLIRPDEQVPGQDGRGTLLRGRRIEEETAETAVRALQIQHPAGKAENPVALVI